MLGNWYSFLYIGNSSKKILLTWKLFLQSLLFRNILSLLVLLGAAEQAGIDELPRPEGLVAAEPNCVLDLSLLTLLFLLLFKVPPALESPEFKIKFQLNADFIFLSSLLSVFGLVFSATPGRGPILLLQPGPEKHSPLPTVYVSSEPSAP